MRLPVYPIKGDEKWELLGKFERLKGLISCPLFIFNSKNIEEEKKRYKKLVKKLFEGLKENLKSLRAIVEDVIKLGKEAFSLKKLHCYTFESVKKWCSLSVLLIGIIINFRPALLKPALYITCLLYTSPSPRD